MRSGKRFVVGLLGTLFVFCILNLAVFTAINAVFGKPDTLKQTLHDSDIYQSAANSIVEQAAKGDQQTQGGEEIALSNPVVQTAIKAVITPLKLQSYAEQIIDGTYHWLDGTTATPDFHIDLTADKQALGTAIGNAAVQHVSTLPVCTLAQLQQIDTNNLDPFNLPCQPPGLNLEAERQKIENQVTGSQEVLKDSTISSQTLADSKNGQDPFQQLNILPKLFQWSRFMPWLMGLGALLCGAGVVLLSTPRRDGFRRLAKTLLITGGMVLGVILLVNFIFGKIHPQAASDALAIQNSVLTIVKALKDNLNHTLLIFALAYAALGTGALVALHLTKPSQSPNPTTSAPKKNKPGKA